LDKGSRHVGLDDGRRLVDAAIDVRFGGKMYDRIATPHRFFYRDAVANVAPYKRITRIFCNLG